MEKVWFITGCSTGFGRELAKLVLERGERAVVTARNPDTARDIVAPYPANRALLLKLDVTDQAQINAATQQALSTFGQIDVLVNNAGIGYFAGMEESEEAEVRRMFEINFFGLAHMTQAVLPAMRQRRSGTIVNISSIGGFVASPAVTFYNASKFAVEALSEGLSKEVAPLGIKVILIEPSGFRTDWAGRSAKESTVEIADYAETAGARRRALREGSGKQAGDPILAAQAIIKVVEAPNPPLRLLLGKYALFAARTKLEELRQDFDTWAETSTGADAPLE